MCSPTDGAHSKAHTCQKLPTDLPTNAANSMRTCSDAQLPMDLPTDVKKYGGIFEIFGVEIN
jgi:hypothetical protein